MPAVSIVMPAYNAADTIEHAIHSIQTQTFTDWELIIVDDASEDPSLDIACRIARDDARIRVVTRGRTGIVSALKAGFDGTQSPYLARMDADDISAPKRLEVQWTLMESNPELALCGVHVQMVGESVGIGRRQYESWLNAIVSHDDVVRNLFIECPLAHPGFFMRRTWYERAGGYQDHGWAEDYDLVMRMWMAGGMMRNVPAVYLQWREHAGRLSMHDARYSLASFRALKRHYLHQTILPAGRRFVQWGAGQVGKAWLREWGNHKPELAVDIHPRKMGLHIHGVPIVAPEALPPPGDCFVVVAVGAPGAREEIRAWLGPRGYEEGPHYVFIA